MVSVECNEVEVVLPENCPELSCESQTSSAHLVKVRIVVALCDAGL